ncbi:MAG: hypothetical protein K2P12_01325 [Clostridia bacterium]|nr:hypothetical protein [Clostridia bacterium]
MNELKKNYNIDIGGMPFALNNCTRNQYRIIANISENVNISILQKAVDMVVPRFPMFTVKMHKRWNSLRCITHNAMKIEISQYSNKFEPFDIYSDKPLFRVMYGEKFVCVEMFHILSDANGCIALLNSILACYYEIFGMKVVKKNIIDHKSACLEGEIEDSYFKYAKKTRAVLSTTKSITAKSFQQKCKSLPERQGIVCTYTFDVQSFKEAAKKYNATLHEYIVTSLCLAFNRMREECGNKKCVRIQMAINLRKRFPSESLRNFVATTQFDTKSYEKEIILQELKKHMEIATSERELQAFMWSAVSLMYGSLRFIPRFIGDFLLKTGDKILGEKANSTSFSNLGVVNNDLDKNGVISYEFIEGTPLYVPFLVSAISFKNICNIVFSKNTEDNLFEQYFLEELQKDNIILTNINVK